MRTALLVVAVAGLVAIRTASPVAASPGDCATFTTTVPISREPKTLLERALTAAAICERAQKKTCEAALTKEKADHAADKKANDERLAVRTSTAIDIIAKSDAPEPESSGVAPFLVLLIAIGAAAVGAGAIALADRLKPL